MAASSTVLALHLPWFRLESETIHESPRREIAMPEADFEIAKRFDFYPGFWARLFVGLWVIDELEQIFILKDIKTVAKWLHSNQELSEVLLEAGQKAKEYFEEADFVLEPFFDEEELPSKQLFFVVLCDLEPLDAKRRLDLFRREYWLSAARPFAPFLGVSIEFKCPSTG